MWGMVTVCKKTDGKCWNIRTVLAESVTEDSNREESKDVGVEVHFIADKQEVQSEISGVQAKADEVGEGRNREKKVVYEKSETLTP